MAEATRIAPMGLTLVLSLPLAATPFAQEEAQAPPAAAAAQEDRDEKDLKRLLHLRNGEVLRARSRFVDDHWEYRTGRDWTALPAGYVERAEEEREVLKRARALERKVDKDDLGARVAHADWMYHTGLRAEALEGIEAVLGVDRDQEAALAFLGRTAPRLSQLPTLDVAPEELPQRVDELVRAAASAGAVPREIAVARLGSIVEDYPVFPELQRALVHSSPRRRAFATLALRRLFPGEEVKQLLVRSVLDSSDSVREGAAMALGDVGDPAVAIPVIKALESQSSTVRVHAAEALGNMGYQAAVAPLMTRLSVPLAAAASAASPRAHIFVGKQFAYIQDFDVEVAQFEAVADPLINVLVEGAVLDARVTGVHVYGSPRERSAIRRSLGQITGAQPGNTTRAWEKWWGENEAKYVSDSNPVTPYPSTSGGK